MTAYSRPAVTVDLKNVIGPGFYDSHRAVREQRAHTLVEEGGRGSLKSSFCSVEIVLWLLKWPQSHALVMRQMGNTLEDSVYSQMLWAVAKLGLSEHFLEKKSPLRLIYKPTGQTIYFRGLDDEMKIKGIKPKFGYIGCLWFEEADQLRRGDNAVLSVKQSAFRGSGSNPTLTLIASTRPPMLGTGPTGTRGSSSRASWCIIRRIWMRRGTGWARSSWTVRTGCARQNR